MGWAEMVAHLIATRKAWGLSRFDVALLLGVTEPTVAHWEAFRRTPNLSQLIAWADALACNVEVRPRP